MLVFIPPIQSVHIIYALLTATQCVQTLKVAKSCVLAPKMLIKETWRVPFALYKEGHDVFNHHSLTRCVKKEKCQLLKFKNGIGLNVCRIRRKRERKNRPKYPHNMFMLMSRYLLLKFSIEIQKMTQPEK